MTGFDLGDPAEDADEQPEGEAEIESETEAEPESESKDVESDSSREEHTEISSEQTDSSSQANETESQGVVDGATDSDATENPDPGEVGPAFPYSEVRQDSLYPRAKTWDKLEDEMGMTLTPKFRESGVRDEELREIHDAMLDVLVDHIDEVHERVLENRIKSYHNEEF